MNTKKFSSALGNVDENYIDEAAARLDKDLEIAKKIQHSALPSVFPPYPNRKDFSIFASMDAAKEVGGDFYDFYLLDETHLAFVVADVSGKGIPGAIAATLGVVFPSLVIISLLAGVIEAFSHLVWVQNAFGGIRVCVCVLIANAVTKLYKR